MRILLNLITAIILVAFCTPALALSQGTTFEATGDEPPISIQRQGGCTTLSQAVEQVRRQYNGRIVSAETIVRSGRETHVIKVLTGDGTVKTVRIPGCRT